eukprot:927687-Prorocentrum_lima.AAC.1
MQHVQVWDINKNDITPLWKEYHELLSSALWWGLFDQCPAPIPTEDYDPVHHSLTVKAPLR